MPEILKITDLHVSVEGKPILIDFPLAYFGYSLIRGAIVDWYPYPFMDVNRHGYDGVALIAVLLAVAMAALTCLLAWINRRLVLHGARVHHEVV